MLQDGQCIADDSICTAAQSSLYQDPVSGMWDCRNATGVTLTFANPCTCNNVDLVTSYQACYPAGTNISIPHYNLVEDTSPPMGLTMQSCSPRSDGYKVITGNPKSDADVEGFLQCPVQGLDVFKPTHFHLWFLSLFYCFPLLTIASYATYKHIKESQVDKALTVYHAPPPPPTEPVPMGTPLSAQEKGIEIERQDTGLSLNNEATGETNRSSMRHIEQAGLKKTRVGQFAFAALIALSVATVAIILIQIFDVYGLLGHTFCVKETQACLADAGDSAYSWREGFKCSAHCLFGDEWSTGQSPYWPYSRGSRGGRIYLLIFLLIWMFAVEFFLVLRGFRSVIRVWFLMRCPLDQATYIYVTLPKRVDSVADFNVHSRAYQLNKFKERISLKLFGPPLVQRMCRIKFDGPTRFFVFQSERYVWRSTEFRFEKATIGVGNDVLDICDQFTGLTSAEASQRSSALGPNQVEIKMPSMARSIFDESFTFQTMYQLLCLVVWYEFYYWFAASIVLSVVFVSIVLSVHCKRSSRKRLVSLAMSCTSILCKRDGSLSRLSSDRLTVGDVVVLERGLEVPCDMVLLQGNIIADEACLTGEPDPVSKAPLQRDRRKFDPKALDLKSCVFAGSRVVAVSEEQALGLVTAISTSTLRGALLKELLSPTRLLFEFDKHWTLVFLILLMWGLINVFIGVALIDWELEGWYYGIFTISQTISPLIPAVFVAGQSVTARRLRKQEIHCAHLPRTIASAKVKHVCFDKTGTMTSPGLTLDFVVPFNTTFRENVYAVSECPEQLQWGLATCHELQKIADDVVGVEVDVQMFKWTTYSLEMSGSGNEWKVLSPFGAGRSIHKRYGFQRTTMCASVVVGTDVYVKGSWETIADLCNEVPPGAAEKVSQLASEGLYVLAMGHKTLEAQASMTRQEVESGLVLLGLLAFKNELVSDAEETIQTLRAAQLNPVMITGDSILTAVKAAKDSGMVDPGLTVYVGQLDAATDTVTWKKADDHSSATGQALEDIMSDQVSCALTGAAYARLEHSLGIDFETFIVRKVKIFARMSPSQKVKVVKVFMGDGITAMIGDGANDAAALESAHVGMAMRSGSSTGSREATVVAHFSCSETEPSLKPVVTLLRLGRCGMASTMAAYKNLIIYGQITVMVSLLEMWLHVVPAEAYWITVDAAVNSLMTWAILASSPAEKLSPKLPSTSLFSMMVAYSIVCQVVVNWAWMISVVILLLQASFSQCKLFDPRLLDHAHWWTKGDNYEAATLGIFAMFQWFSAAPVVSFGNGYRAKWIKSYRVHLLWAAFMVLLLSILFTTASPLSCIFRTNCGDASLLNAWYEAKIDGGIVGRAVPAEGTLFIPPGCPCESLNCELEHTETCNANHYNSQVHHNIFPRSWRYTLLAAMALNLVCNYGMEVLLLRKDNAKYKLHNRGEIPL